MQTKIDGLTQRVAALEILVADHSKKFAQQTRVAFIGSKEWCAQMEAKLTGASLEEMSKLTPEEQQGIAECMMDALGAAQKE